jgi:hypothetical protein
MRGDFVVVCFKYCFEDPFLRSDEARKKKYICNFWSLTVTLGNWLGRGRAVAEAGIRWLSTAAARVRSLGSGKWDLWWTKWRRGRFSQITSVSPGKTVYSTNFSILTITRDRYNRPGVAAVPSGPSLDSNPQYSNKKLTQTLRSIFDFCLWPKYIFL